jgi:protein-S-isoprenylcysteine O-methyltransferase Ste14
MVYSSYLFLYFYVLSVGPAGLSKVIGDESYTLCAMYRQVAIFFEMLGAAGYVIYFYYPLPLPFPRTFSWGWNVSRALGLLIGAPSLWVMFRGMRDAGEESLSPDKEHEMFGGIYEYIRHPQALGEAFLRFSIGFMFNSPFLVAFSLIDIPMYLIMCRAEEQDLILRFGDSYVDYMKTTGAFIPKRKRY